MTGTEAPVIGKPTLVTVVPSINAIYEALTVTYAAGPFRGEVPANISDASAGPGEVVYGPGADFVVLEAPDGNLFCVVQKDS